MITLHGPDGSVLYIRKDGIIAMHVCLKGEQVPGASTTLHLANGQEWHVSETTTQISAQLGK